jgi:hypothetical protein
MKRNSLLFEVFPYKYYKDSYSRLAATYGVHYRWTQNKHPTSFSRQVLRLVSQDVCMYYRKCRSHARGDSVVMTREHIADVLQSMRDIESFEFSRTKQSANN